MQVVHFIQDRICSMAGALFALIRRDISTSLSDEFNRPLSLMGPPTRNGPAFNGLNGKTRGKMTKKNAPNDSCAYDE